MPNKNCSKKHNSEFFKSFNIFFQKSKQKKKIVWIIPFNAVKDITNGNKPPSIVPSLLLCLKVINLTINNITINIIAIITITLLKINEKA